jgi:hypothetical protein
MADQIPELQLCPLRKYPPLKSIFVIFFSTAPHLTLPFRFRNPHATQGAAAMIRVVRWSGERDVYHLVSRSILIIHFAGIISNKYTVFPLIEYLLNTREENEWW